MTSVGICEQCRFKTDNFSHGNGRRTFTANICPTETKNAIYGFQFEHFQSKRGL